MLVIRLRRTGRKNQPSFRIVVTDKKKAAGKGIPVEEVGFYNPLSKERVLKKERILYWISKGAKPSETVHNMLVTEKVIEAGKMPKHGASKKVAEEVKPPAEKPAAQATEVKEEEKSAEATASEQEEVKKEETPASQEGEGQESSEKQEEAAPSDKGGEVKEA